MEQTSSNNHCFTTIKFKENDIVLSKYKIIKQLGEGGMSSIVYKAEDITADNGEYVGLKERFVAIKVINKDDTWTDADWDKIHDECITSQRVSNKKNIVNTYEISKMNSDNTIIIVMEHIDGISLRDYMDKNGLIPIKESIYFFEKILHAIKELHSFNEKVIHRDLKPENVMLTMDLINVKIIDFGISSVLIKSSINNDKEVITNEQTMFGTYAYICPDVLEIKKLSNDKKLKIIGEQYDFFALGVIFYEMLTGQKPFKAKNDSDISVIELPLKYDMLCISDIDPAITVPIENIIFRCIASKKDDLKFRYHSIDEIIHDLNDYCSHPEKVPFTKLLKPKNLRTYQLSNAFKVSAQISKEKFYEKHWFYWLIFSAIALIILITIFLLIL